MQCSSCGADLEEVGVNADLATLNCSVKDGRIEVIVHEVEIDGVWCASCGDMTDVDAEIKIVDYFGKEIE